MIKIKVENVEKVFNKRSRNANHVLKGVSFELPEKGLVAIFGKSGSGKTTLLNIIGGLDKQDGGHVYIDNEDTKGKVDKIRNAKIGYIFQNYYLESGYTIAEILRNSMLIAGFKDEKEILRRTDEVLKLVKMDRYKNKKADALSGGQKQRVAIARALIKGSDIILADEPTGNLDAENTISIMEILKEISKEQLVVLVTHEVNLIENYADSHIKIVDGELKDNEELEADIKYETTHNNIYVDKNDIKSAKIGKTNVNLYGKEIETGDIELYSDKGVMYLKAGENVSILTEGSEKKVIFNEVKDDEAKQKPESIKLEKFKKSNSKRNGRLFNIKSIFSLRKLCPYEEQKSSGNIFKNIFIMAIAIVMCFLSLSCFEITTSTIETKEINPNSLYLNLNTYYDIKMIDQTSITPLYDKVDFFDTKPQSGDFSFKETNELSSASVSFVARPIKDEDELTIGAYPKLGEILISSNLSNELQHKFRQKELQKDSSMLLLELDGEYDVVGIIKSSKNEVIMNKQDYVNYLGVYNEIQFTDQENHFFKDEYKEVYYKSEIVVDDGSRKLAKNETHIEINRNSLYKMVPDVVEADYLVKRANIKLQAHKGPTTLLIRNSDLYVKELAITRQPFDSDIRIYVSPEAMENIFVYLKPNINSIKNTKANENFYYELVTSSDEQLNELKELVCDELDIPLVDVNKLYEEELSKLKEEELSKVSVFIIIIILLMLIYYFIEKSGSLKNSKEYGIFRAIGVNRSNLLYKEAMITLRENILVYFISFVIVTILMCVRYFMMNVAFGIFVAIAASVMVLSSLLMMLISLVPYLFVLFKSPAAILARYDI